VRPDTTRVASSTKVIIVTECSLLWENTGNLPAVQRSVLMNSSITALKLNQLLEHCPWKKPLIFQDTKRLLIMCKITSNIEYIFHFHHLQQGARRVFYTRLLTLNTNPRIATSVLRYCIVLCCIVL
jgi:hypothetical protein